jgi:hypothetical protein
MVRLQMRRAGDNADAVRRIICAGIQGAHHWHEAMGYGRYFTPSKSLRLVSKKKFDKEKLARHIDTYSLLHHRCDTFFSFFSSVYKCNPMTHSMVR